MAKPIKIALVTGLISVITLFTGCQYKKVNPGNVFRYNESKGIATIDPAFARSQTIIWPVNQVFNGLVQFDHTLTIKPSIARKWEVSDDGLYYTFYLRNDVLFHASPVFVGQGQRKVTAQDFVYSFNRIMYPVTASPGAWVFRYLDATFGQNGVKAVSDTVLKLKLTKPFPPFLGILGMKYCSVVPKEAVEFYGKEFGHYAVGTGPFYVKYWRRNEALVLRKNPDYFEKDAKGNRLPYLESVYISFIPDKQSEFMEFMLGNLDFISGINAQYKDALLTRAGNLREELKNDITLQTAPYLNTEYLGFNLDSTIGTVVPPAIRKAINMCFSRREMIAFLRNNMAYPATRGMEPPPLTRNYPEPVGGYSFNLKKAREIMAKAGYKGGYPQTIKLFTTSDYVDICEYIQHKASALGIDIQIELGTGASFRNRISSGKAMFFRGSWIADYPDAENYLSLFYSPNQSPNGPNHTRFADPVADSLYKRALQTVNEAEKNRLYYQLGQRVMDQAPVVPLFYDKVVRFVRNEVEGFEVNPLNLLELKHVRKK